MSTNNSQLTSLFTYDGYGRRVQIIELTNGAACTTNKYLWTGLSMAEQRTVAGAVTKRFFGQGEQISGTSYYFTRDHLGSVREMLDAAGNLQARYDYDPYGRRSKLAGSLDADFGYTGHFYHAASGLCLTLFRAYDPDLGRWLSRDPIAEQGGLNLYGYVLNDPVNLLDLFGAQCGPSGAVQVGKGFWDAANNTADSALNQRTNLNTIIDNDPGNPAAYDPTLKWTAMGNTSAAAGSNFNNAAKTTIKASLPPVVKTTDRAFTYGTAAYNQAMDIASNPNPNSTPSGNWFYSGQDSLNNFKIYSDDSILLPDGTRQFTDFKPCY